MDRETSGRDRTTEERMRDENEEMRNRRMGTANVTGPRGDEGVWRGERSTVPYRGMSPYSSSSVGPWESPVSILQHMSEEMDRLFDIFFSRGMGTRPVSGAIASPMAPRGGFGRSVWAPELDIYEEDGQLKIVADLPGLNKDDVQIEFRDGMLIIEGERRDEHEDKGNGGFRRVERHYGRFYRTVQLPEGVNPEEAKAKFKNGELVISVPAPRRPQGRRLDIQTEDR